MQHQVAWDALSERYRMAVLVCALLGRGVKITTELGAMSWNNLPETVRSYVLGTDWEFAIGKCRYQW